MKTHYFQRWIIGWLDILCGIITVLTLGIIMPSFSFKIMAHFTKMNMWKIQNLSKDK